MSLDFGYENSDLDDSVVTPPLEPSEWRSPQLTSSLPAKKATDRHPSALRAAHRRTQHTSSRKRKGFSHIPPRKNVNSDSEPSDDEVASLTRDKASSLQSTLKDMQNKSNYAKTDKTTLNGIADGLTNQIQLLSQRLAERNATIKDMITQADQHSSELAAAKRSESLHMDQARAAGEDLNRQKSHVQRKEAEMETLRQQCSNNKQLATDKQQLLNVASSENTQLKQELKAIQSDLAREKEKREEQGGQLKVREGQLEEQSSQAEQCANNILAKESTIGELRNKIREQQQTISFQDERIEGLQAQETRFHAEIDSKEAKIQQLISEAEGKHAEVEMLWDRVVLLQTGSRKRTREEWRTRQSYEASGKGRACCWTDWS
jgi:chromosome segregation ATPase